MATFYLLPPRPLVADSFAQFLQGWFPGLDWSRHPWADLANSLGAAASQHANVYIVYREDLPDGEPTEVALANGFGAEPGDKIVEVHSSPRAGSFHIRQWRFGEDTPF